MVSPGARSLDAVVVGAGPAGSLAAHQLAAAGASVLVLERRHMPRWKVCGSCVGVGALSVLADVGLGDLPRLGGAVPLSELVVQTRRRRAILPLEGGVSWSRAAMDEALMRAAERAGATCWTGAHARIGPMVDGHRTVTARMAGRTVEVRARVVVDAAGLGGAPHSGAAHATIRSHARVGMGGIVAGDALVGSASALPPGRIHMVVGRTGYVGIVRLEDGSVDVAAALDASVLRSGTPAAAVGEILLGADLRLEGAPTRGWRGTPQLTRTSTRPAEAGLFRIGDAMGYVEPFTGEGIGWALASARAVAPVALRGIDHWDASIERCWYAYATGQAERTRRLCRLVSRALRHPLLVDGVLGVLTRAPALAMPWVRRTGRVPQAPQVSGGRHQGLGGGGDGREAA